MRLVLTALALLLLAAPAAYAGVHETEHGTIYVPDGLAPDAVVPVLIVEGGLAREHGTLWSSLGDRTKVIIAETVDLRPLRGKTEKNGLVGAAVTAVLAEAQKVHDVARCPWVVLGFSQLATSMAHLPLLEPERFQGLVIANGGIWAGTVLVDRGAVKGLPVLILNCKKDVISPIERTEELLDTLKSAGADVSLVVLESDEHMAPVQVAGADALAAFFAKAAKRPVPDRSKSPPYVTIETKGSDDLALTADLWSTGDKSAPMILLYHQARSSRAEYRPIAKRLVALGYNALALDARAGAAWGGVLNETAARARAKELGTKFEDARADLERAVAWVRELGYEGKLVQWGSSYSAALVLALGQAEGIDAVIAFSPGDYVSPRRSTPKAAEKLTKPVLIIAPPREEVVAQRLHDLIASEKKSIFIQPDGLHGSRTLYASTTAEDAWKKVEAFLAGL